jgi:hypothetical protein
MKRFSMLSLSAVSALAVVSISDSTFAQQRVSRDQLVGTWTLVSCTGANGGTPAECVNPDGRMMLDAMGQYMFSIAPRGRPKCSGVCGRAQMSADQYKAIARAFFSNFGPWSFNDADQTVALTNEVSILPNREGREFKSKVSLTGDELRLTGIGAGGAAGDTVIWRRAR